jgi:hypothetical protein
MHQLPFATAVNLAALLLSSMDDALDAYRRLEAGELAGRAVVTPHG